MWVYRAERSPFAQDASTEHKRKPRHIEIPFHESSAAARTWTQRIAKEPRVPKPEGYKFVTDADAEMHYLLKAILLRPIYLPDQLEDDETKQMLLLRAFRDLCTAPEDEPPWPAHSEGQIETWIEAFLAMATPTCDGSAKENVVAARQCRSVVLALALEYKRDGTRA